MQARQRPPRSVRPSWHSVGTSAPARRHTSSTVAPRASTSRPSTRITAPPRSGIGAEDRAVVWGRPVRSRRGFPSRGYRGAARTLAARDSARARWCDAAGVQLPHDSAAAKPTRCSTSARIETVASKTTIPPWPCQSEPKSSRVSNSGSATTRPSDRPPASRHWSQRAGPRTFALQQLCKRIPSSASTTPGRDRAGEAERLRRALAASARPTARPPASRCSAPP